MWFFFSSRRRHTIFKCDWSSDVCSSDLADAVELRIEGVPVLLLLGCGHQIHVFHPVIARGDELLWCEAAVDQLMQLIECDSQSRMRIGRQDRTVPDFEDLFSTRLISPRRSRYSTPRVLLA